ncbi:MAG: VWA domain-containing protein [Eubacteriales bacterium]|jgi:uncharacterized protein YegL|nr:VWA domain-containing protein [Eubacteriales bacterium]MDD3198014.1 VWA domain-containing protein [Eubacteriales bacterium]MDD3504321.1 VWA domain-containing protein [Eubacteriales bacterium]MDD4682728.1 VWA domain-containing protein [Eubacteriales bacterium]
MSEEFINDGPVLEGEITKRPLQFFWLVDCSGSMRGKKIATLNQAIREAVPEILRALEAHPEVQVMMRAIAFSSSASWHVGPEAVKLEDFTWPPLHADGYTATASAIELLLEELDIDKMNRRGFPPVCVLLSDGYCTEPEEQYERAIRKLDHAPWGKKAVRLVIAIGDGSEYDEQALLRFTNHPEVGVLKANTPGKLVEYIKWASVTASVSSSQSKTFYNDDEVEGGEGEGARNVILASAPQSIQIEDANEVF